MGGDQPHQECDGRGSQSFFYYTRLEAEVEVEMEVVEGRRGWFGVCKVKSSSVGRYTWWSGNGKLKLKLGESKGEPERPRSGAVKLKREGYLRKMSTRDHDERD